MVRDSADKFAYAVVICLSKETETRMTKDMYPEAADAVAARRRFHIGRLGRVDES